MKNYLTLAVMLIAVSAQAQTTRSHSNTSSARVSARSTASQSSSTRLELPAHESSVTSPSLELKGGAEFANINQVGYAPANDPQVGYGSRMGLNFGAFINLPTSSLFSLNTGLQFIQKGAKYQEKGATAEGVPGTYEVSTGLNYLELPVLARLNFGQSVRFNIAAGPYAALKLGTSKSTKFIPNNDQAQDLPQEEGASALSALDFGLRAGVGVEFPLSPSMGFLVGADYDFGLKNISQVTTSPIDGNVTPSIKTRTLIANVGLAVNL